MIMQDAQQMHTHARMHDSAVTVHVAVSVVEGTTLLEATGGVAPLSVGVWVDGRLSAAASTCVEGESMGADAGMLPHGSGDDQSRLGNVPRISSKSSLPAGQCLRGG